MNYKESDLFKAIGYVTIYFANFEDKVDKLLEKSKLVFPYDDKIMKYGIGSKIDFLKKNFKKSNLKTPLSERYNPKILEECEKIAKERNKLLHNPIFDNGKGGAFQKMKNQNSYKLTNDRTLDYEEIIIFAEKIVSYCGGIDSLTFVIDEIRNSRP